jgi:hypothetical protein
MRKRQYTIRGAVEARLRTGQDACEQTDHTGCKDETQPSTEDTKQGQGFDLSNHSLS